jgi:hypothetical protein
MKSELRYLLKDCMTSQLTTKCTHLIYQSTRPLNETFKEIAFARSNMIHIVSPYWFKESAKKSLLLPETEFPPAYDPKRCLSMFTAPICSSNNSNNNIISKNNGASAVEPNFKSSIKSVTSNNSISSHSASTSDMHLEEKGNDDYNNNNEDDNMGDCSPSLVMGDPSDQQPHVNSGLQASVEEGKKASEPSENATVVKSIEKMVDSVLVNELLLETMKKSGKVGER